MSFSRGTLSHPSGHTITCPLTDCSLNTLTISVSPLRIKYGCFAVTTIMPWTSGFFLFMQSGVELFEYICQENNFASTLMIGAQESVDRTSQIVP